jgi:hypothetical protein
MFMTYVVKGGCRDCCMQTVQKEYLLSEGPGTRWLRHQEQGSLSSRGL